jgi:hypothetical protein
MRAAATGQRLIFSERNDLSLLVTGLGSSSWLSSPFRRDRFGALALETQASHPGHRQFRLQLGAARSDLELVQRDVPAQRATS